MHDSPDTRNPNISPSAEEFLTTREVAEWLRVHPSTVRRTVPATRYGRKWLYRRSDVQDVLDRSRNDAA